MKLFVTITCFALVATAAADVGYNYNLPKSGVKQNIRPQVAAASSGAYSAQLAPPLAAFNVQAQPQIIKQNFIAAPALAPLPVRQYVQQQQAFSLPQVYNQAAAQPAQYVLPAQQSAVYAPTFAAASSGSAQLQFNQQPLQQQQQTIISKDIYIHSAPEDTEEISVAQEQEAVPIRKNYRIVFIKAPAQNIKYSLESLKRTQAANEEKTVIYVLSKKPDITTIHNQLTAIQTESKSHKPEVYFIKYKTPEEASRAQQEIQAQYDALGGSTRVSDEGIAPITSVISGEGISGSPSLAASASVGGLSLSGNSNFIQAASNNQQQFVQSSIQGSQGSASSLNFAVQGPGNKYLPAKQK